MKKDKIKDILLKIAICSAGYGLFSDSVVIPLVTAIMNEYPDVSTFLQNYVISGNAIAGLIFGLLTGVLLKYVRKKPLLIFGTIMFVIAGVAGAFSKDLVFLAWMRTIDSASDGILTITTAAMIVDLWKSEEEQGFVFGLYNAISGLFGCIASMVAGYAALVSWRSAFWVNSIGILPVILCILFVPDTAPGMASPEEAPEEPWEKDLKWRPMRFIGAMIALNVMQTISYAMAMLMDVFVAEQNIGNSVVTGNMSIVVLVVSTVANLIAGSVLARTRKKHMFAFLCSVLLATGAFLYAVCNSVFILAVANGINVLSQCFALIYFEIYTVRSVPRKQRTICLSIMTQTTYVDAVLCTYVPDMTRALFGTETLAQCFGVCGVCMVFFCMMYLFFAIRGKVPENAYA